MRVRLGVVAGVGLAMTLLILAALAFVIRRQDPDPERYPVAGIDISHHQGPIDWLDLADSDVAFVFMKASEGQDFTDPRFHFNWMEAKIRDLPRGAYHFFTFCSPGLDQARHFLNVVPPEAGALTPVADVEFGGNCTSYEDLEQVRRELAIFLSEVEAAWGRKPILYLTFRSALQIADARFDDYPVWFRNLYWRLPSDASHYWMMWQYSDSGEVPGIKGPVDRNVLHPDVTVDSLRVDP